LTARLSKVIERALKYNGFKKTPTHHNQYRYYTLAGKKAPVKTFISHGTKDYGDDLLSKMADQLKLTKKELLMFIDGKMKRKEYEDILKKQGII